MNRSIRTDLALEMHEFVNQQNNTTAKQNYMQGVDVSVEKNEDITITRVKITSKEGESALGKPIGNYITIESLNIKNEPINDSSICNILSSEIHKLIHLESQNNVLLIGLGNKDITPDSLGPEVVSKLIITRHIVNTIKSNTIRPVCAIATGVLGTTGIETVEIVKGIVEKVNPKLVIVVDALAARSTSRIGTTIQLSDTGISPGSGVGNNRKELSLHTLNIPVVSIGIPTVIDRNTLIYDVIENISDKIKPSNYSTVEDIFSNLTQETNMIVTPKEIDSLIQTSSKIIATGINNALHNALDFKI